MDRYKLKNSEVKAVKLGAPIKRATDDEWASIGGAGDYLIELSPGVYEIRPANEFEAEYEKWY